MKKEVYLPSTDRKHKLHLVIWEPEGEIKAILQISHGMIEYIERYDDFANYLNGQGILVAGNDHLGHGKSVRNDDEFGYFGKGKSALVVNDLYHVTKYLKKKYGEDKVYILLGHSMGSFMARRYIMTYKDSLDAAIISGTGYTDPISLNFGKFMTQIIGFFRGQRYRSNLLHKLAFGTYNKKIKNPTSKNSWLTKDETIVENYDKCKYCTFNFTVNGYKTLSDAITLIQKKENMKKIPKNLPLYFFSGEEDPVGGYGKGVRKVYTQYKNLGIEKMQIKMYKGDRHEVLNELDKKEAYEAIAKYVLELVLVHPGTELV